VVQAKCVTTGKMVAIKFIQDVCHTDYDCVKVIREIVLMRRLSQIEHNTHTAKLLDLIIPPKDLNDGKFGIFLVMEFSDMDLRQYLKKDHASDNFSEENVIKISYNLLCALKFVHSTNVLHRDIKPSNILIDDQMNTKLCDFGLSRSLPESCIGKGSGNSKRMRDSILKANLSSIKTNEEIRSAIAHKLQR
jgi:serine/threonine protein kinase